MLPWKQKIKISIFTMLYFIEWVLFVEKILVIFIICYERFCFFSSKNLLFLGDLFKGQNEKTDRCIILLLSKYQTWGSLSTHPLFISLLSFVSFLQTVMAIILIFNILKEDDCLKELSFGHKLKFSNPIIAIWRLI